MFHARLPIAFRRGIDKMVVMIVKMRCVHLIIKEASFINRLGIAGIGTSHIQSNRIKRSKHTNVRNNRYIIFTVAVAIRRYIHDNINVKLRTPTHYCFRIFCHFHAKFFRSTSTFV